MFNIIEWWRTRNLRNTMKPNETNFGTIANLRVSLRRGSDGKIRFKTIILGEFKVNENNETVKEIQKLIEKMEEESKINNWSAFFKHPERIPSG